jgi:hypothetical protein
MQVATNLINMALAVAFVLGLGWGVPGVAAATLIAEWAGAAVGFAIALCKLGRLGGRLEAARLLDGRRLRRLVAVNLDIFLRTLTLVFGFAFFVAQGAKAGDATLAANAVMLNFLHIMAYGLDGFAFAAEALVGAAFGARNRAALREAVRLTTIWAGLCALAFALAYAALGLLADRCGVELSARRRLHRRDAHRRHAQLRRPGARRLSRGVADAGAFARQRGALARLHDLLRGARGDARRALSGAGTRGAQKPQRLVSRSWARQLS